MAHLYLRGRVYWLKWYQDGKCYQQSLKTRDKTAAKFFKNEKENQLAKGTSPLPRKDSSPLEVLQEYEKSSQHRKTAHTLKDDSARIKRFLHWANATKISQVNGKKTQDYISHRFKTDKVTPNTANHIITSLKTFLNFAVRNGYLSDNPLKYLKKYRLQKNPPKFYSEEEINRLLSAAKAYGRDFYPLIAAGVYAGLRISELLNLEWQDIDWDRKIIRIVNKAGFITKSKEFRVVPLNQRLAEILQPYRKDKGYCFFPKGSRAHPPKKGFYAILKAAGLKKSGFHILRHTCASHLAMRGVDISTISKILGHANITTTQIYMHLTPNHLQDSIEKLNF